jgi:hypothetical protein
MAVVGGRLVSGRWRVDGAGRPYPARIPASALTDAHAHAHAEGTQEARDGSEPRVPHPRRGAADLAVAEAAVRALAGLVGEGRLRALELGRVDGVPVAESPLRGSLAAAGFRASYRGWVLRAPAR